MPLACMIFQQRQRKVSLICYFSS
uniref:Uncharacterized protein n=1 Tax=Arundo donax TaxID=35708 RepID=A0A0A8ZJ15_ARUDO